VQVPVVATEGTGGKPQRSAGLFVVKEDGALRAVEGEDPASFDIPRWRMGCACSGHQHGISLLVVFFVKGFPHLRPVFLYSAHR
jgi:hypothetical protein